MITDRRQNPIDDNEVFEQSLNEILNAFSDEWLLMEGNNPLQKLWKRRDWLSSTELINFGVSLGKVKTINRRWYLDSINKIKNGDANNIRGAIFETLIAGFSHLPPLQTVELTPANNPGYDLIIRLNEYSIVKSLKNYGHSVHSQIVQEKAKELEELIIENLKHDVQIVISREEHPSNEDWIALKNNIVSILESPKSLNNIDGWTIMVMPLVAENGVFCQNKKSYSLLVAVPYHRNEDQNLYSKIDEACYNLVTHGCQENDNVFNMVILKLPIQASMIKCSEWANSYFETHTDKPISGIILYQPALVNNSNGSNHLAHAYRLILNPRRRELWIKQGLNNLKMEFQIGICQNYPTQNALIIDGKTITLENLYLYQSGHHYYFVEGTGEHHLSAINGIHIHGIFRINGGDIEMTGIFPPTNELLLF